MVFNKFSKFSYKRGIALNKVSWKTWIPLFTSSITFRRTGRNIRECQSVKIARFRAIDLRKCFYTGKRDLAARHLPYSKDTLSYKINFNLLTDHDEFFAMSSRSEQALGNSGNYTVVQFGTNDEKDNLIKFLYSDTGFKFIAKLFTAINVDCYVVPAIYLPKVDWTHEWTVEEILKDYGYTELEIENIMEDLNNFRGMDD